MEKVLEKEQIMELYLNEDFILVVVLTEQDLKLQLNYFNQLLADLDLDEMAKRWLHFQRLRPRYRSL